jgi:hypothetical protein
MAHLGGRRVHDRTVSLSFPAEWLQRVAASCVDCAKTSDAFPSIRLPVGNVLGKNCFKLLQNHSHQTEVIVPVSSSVSYYFKVLSSGQESDRRF